MPQKEAPKKELIPKPYVVTAPDGKEHMVYAPTGPSAIREMREHLSAEHQWDARLATCEEMYNAAMRGTSILNAPESIAPSPQGDLIANGDNE